MEHSVKDDTDITKHVLMRQIDDYRAKNPELKNLMHNYLMEAILQKPEDVEPFTKQFFSKYLKPQVGLIISGPSGVGKGTIKDKLLSIFPEAFGFSVSHTTRDPRPGEIDGVDYFFTDKETISKDMRNGLFLENAEVHGNIYGTSVQAYQTVVNQGKICLFDIDIQGFKSIMASDKIPKPHSVFITAPQDVIEARLRGRGTDSEAAIERRLNNANDEIVFGTSGVFEYVLVNDDLDLAVTQLKLKLYQWYPYLKALE